MQGLSPFHICRQLLNRRRSREHTELPEGEIKHATRVESDGHILWMAIESWAGSLMRSPHTAVPECTETRALVVKSTMTWGNCQTSWMAQDYVVNDTYLRALWENSSGNA